MRNVRANTIALIGFFVALAVYVLYRVFFTTHVQVIDVVFAAWFGGVVSVILIDKFFKTLESRKSSRKIG